MICQFILYFVSRYTRLFTLTVERIFHGESKTNERSFKKKINYILFKHLYDTFFYLIRYIDNLNPLRKQKLCLLINSTLNN